MYGHQVNTFDKDKFAKRVFKSAARFAGSLAPGAFLVDMMPWLIYVPSWMPGAGWKNKAAEWAEDDRQLYTEMREAARVPSLSSCSCRLMLTMRQENATKQPSFISEGLGEQSYGVTEEELAYIGGTISQTPDTVR